ncbi:MAG: NAD(P)/FAD-dependent oxidoreductase, partial [Actinomycetota bacterium]|nr:NAD(P)/FAD-dependent oxidoreductase [Actinomycetota bacterium]
SWTVWRWATPAARALFGGVAAHAVGSLSAPLSSAVGVLLGAAGHAVGWPVAEGGSRAVTDALLGVLRGLGGTVETGRRVDALEQLGAPDVVLLDVSPRAALRILGDRLPARTARAYRRYAYGPAAYKVDLAVRGGVPWSAEACRHAGTVHLGGTFEELAAAEAAVVRGVLPRRPFVLVAQQSLADPGRAVGDVHPVWAYAHVPHGHRGDVTEAVLAQVERFAPGVRERVVGLAVRDVAALERHDENYVGGDIAVGASTPRQLLLRPRAALDPYATGVPGVYLCSSATPPGAGVHGMCGHGAATSALRGLGRAA